LLVELKRGMISNKDIGQLTKYAGVLLQAEGKLPPLRLMIVGTRLGPNLKVGLRHVGIEWQEIDLSKLRHFLAERGDADLAERLRDEGPASVSTTVQDHAGSDRTEPSGGKRSSLFSVSVGGQRVGPATFPAVMRRLYQILVGDFSVTPEALLSCSNVRLKQRFEVLPHAVKTKEEFARYASNSLCDEGRFEIFDVHGKTCGITTHWGSGGARRVIKRMQEQFPKLHIEIEMPGKVL